MSGMEILMLGGTALSAMGSIRQGQAAEMSANFNAESARMQGEAKEAVQRRDSQRVFGQTRAAIGKSGITTAGTPMTVIAESAANAEIDALNTQFGSLREEALYRARGKYDKQAAYMQAGATLLGGASKIA
jgi:hypothetical protein